MGTLIKQLLPCVRTEAIRCRPFATAIQTRLTCCAVCRRCRRRFHSRGVATQELNRFFDRVYIATHCIRCWPRRIEPTRACLRSAGPAHESLPVIRAKGRMETADMPDSGWQVSVEAKMCGCRTFSKMGYCVHLQYALSVRDKLDLFGRTRLVCRGRNRAQRAPRCGSSCK
ncbi:hypothetical protein GQ600_6430 [Phytophthora cactorum]|nr:hypothetical protein GQ600_6430 [Phytophthora cactorum]